MKNKLHFFLCFVLVSLILSCQGDKKNEVVAIKGDKNRQARRECGTSYKFLAPTDDYGYNGDGCVSYYVHRGSTRQVKVIMSNTVGYPQNLQIEFAHPDDYTSITYSVASITGGSTFNQSPGAPGLGSSIVWTATNMPAYATYEMVINISGVPGGSPAENGVHLVMDSPCQPTPLSACDADENLHLVLTD